MTAPTQPFQRTFQANSNAFGVASDTILVPPHKRLVIEYVSASLNQFVPGVGGSVNLMTTSGGQAVIFHLVKDAFDYNKRNQSVRLYADLATMWTCRSHSSVRDTGETHP